MKKKTVKVVLGAIASSKNIDRAVKSATRGRFRYKPIALVWNENAWWYNTQLKKLIKQGKYKTGKYTRFTIQDTKKRIIHAPSFIDKIVQYALNNVIREVYEPCYIQDSYACIRKKGPQACIKQLHRYQRLAYKKFKEPVLVKLDISKFFYSINRSIVFDILCKKIKDTKVRALLVEKLKFNVSHIGLPLGNLTAQQFANILLNEFDHWVKRCLKVKYYCRYADDMFMLVDGRDYGKEVMKLCKEYIEYKLDLKCNTSKCYVRSANTIEALGHVVNYDGPIMLLGRNMRRLKKILKTKYVLDKGISTTIRRNMITNKKSNFRKATNEDILIRLNSWYGHFQLANIHGLIDYVWKITGEDRFVFDKELNKFVMT